VIFIDAFQVRIRDGQVAYRRAYTVIGVPSTGMRDVLGLWVGDGGEGAKYWHQVLSEIRNRGRASSTGTSSPAISARSTPPRPSKRRGTASTSSPTSDAQTGAVSDLR
jgi:hypothetical protein